MPSFARLVATALLACTGLLVQAAPDGTLYRALGERPGIAALTTDFVTRLKADPRTHPFFKDIRTEYLSGQLGILFCQLSGGPCRRDQMEAPDMRRVHANLGVQEADFNALVEVLQQTMDAQRIPFAVQNHLLARLAPMHREIVTR